MIHIEADIHATEGNRNGFPKDAFIFWLVVHYTIVPRRRRPEVRRADPRHVDADGRPRRLSTTGRASRCPGPAITG